MTIPSNIVDAINAAQFVAFDTETDGLNTRKNHVIGIGVATDSLETYYTNDVADMLQLASLLVGKPLVAYNAYFDIEMVRNNFGIDLWDSLHADVILLKHTVDEEMPFKLKEVAAKILGADSKDEKMELDASIKANGGKKGEVWLADPAIIAKYCIQDCVLTMKLFKHYSKQLIAEKMENFFYLDEVMPLYKNVTRYLQSHGIAVDVPLTTQLHTEIQVDIANLHAQIQELLKPHLSSYTNWYINKHFKPARTGVFAQKCAQLSNSPLKCTASGAYSLAAKGLEPYKQNPFIAYLLGAELTQTLVKKVQDALWAETPTPFNISSKLDLKKVLFDELGEEPLTRTKLGAPQIDDAFLKTIEDKYEWVRLLRNYNKLIKIKSSYFDRILERHEDGIYYPQFFQHRTVSGRFGSDLQQLSRKKEKGDPTVLKYNNQIRDLFIARKNNKLIVADYNSLEPRVFAHVSGEQRIKNIFNKGHDLYSTVAIDTEDLKGVSANKKDDNYLEKIDKEKRNESKIYTLGIPYGMESFNLSRKLNCSQEEAESKIQKYFKAYPNLHAWFKECDKQFKLKGISISEAGRKRHLKKQQAALFRLGDHNLNALELWKTYNNDPAYADKKIERKFVKNGLNNFRNHQIQSLAASIINRACIAFRRKINNLNINANIILQAHDEALVECSEKDVDLVSSILQDCMENTYKLSLPLIANPVIGDRYGDIK